MRKCILYISCLYVFLSFLLLPVSAHPGRTDSKGGHTDHSTGEYHYHHGHSAHEHYDMDGDGDIDCPYDFDDKTGQNSGTSSGSSGSINKTTASQTGGNTNSFWKSIPPYGVFCIIAVIAEIILFVIGFCVIPDSDHVDALVIIGILLYIAALPANLALPIVILILGGVKSFFAYLINKAYCKPYLSAPNEEKINICASIPAWAQKLCESDNKISSLLKKEFKNCVKQGILTKEQCAALIITHKL